MATINAVLAEKGPHVMSIGPDASVLEASLLMNEHKIGCLVVTDRSRVVGIFTERDVLVRVVAQRLDPALTKIRDAMTRDVICCSPQTPIDEARSVFKNRRIRHLPVVDDAGKPHGLVSIGDLNAHLASAQEQTIHYLHEYIYGRV